jgi:hypothetical protein
MAVSENYDAFVDRLKSSRAAVFRVAEWVHRGDMYSKGRSVYIPAIRICPPNENPSDYLDDGDLFVNDGEKGRLKLEVKHKQKLNFTSRFDYPFKDVFVSNVDTVERNWGTVEAYIVVNHEMTHAIIIPNHTRDKWVIREVLASNTKRLERYYVCPLNVVSFRKISE